jgi:hypothetical protein
MAASLELCLQPISLSIVQDIGRTMETVAIQVQKMEELPLAVNLTKVHNWSNPRTHMKKQICYRCGKLNHFAKDPACPARKATCRRCGLVGHYKPKFRHYLICASILQKPSFASVQIQSVHLKTLGFVLSGVPIAP